MCTAAAGVAMGSPLSEWRAAMCFYKLNVVDKKSSVRSSITQTQSTHTGPQQKGKHVGTNVS